MKKGFLVRLNVLLGLLSFVLVGCHCGKKAAETSAPNRPEPRKYGPPSADIRRPAPAEAPDSVPMPNEPQPCKYGIPNPELL